MKKKRYLLSLIFLFAVWLSTHAQIPSTALEAYIQKEDQSHVWEVVEVQTYNDCKVYSIFLISQKWQDMLWKHELTLYVPDALSHAEGVLLFITGGDLDENRMVRFSDRSDKISQSISEIALSNQAPTAVLRQVPNQPLYGHLKEDALIAHTLNQFRETSDYTSPLLFPMVKSVVKAMDTLEEFLKIKEGKSVKNFLISGISKRGWTTWLTAATQDPRVVAIAPMVIEMLNFPEFFKSQYLAYGDFSEKIGDYVKLNIPQALESDFGKQVVKMIDPYSYLDKITIPKLIVMGTNDPYWTIDAIQNYIHQIPGTCLLHYVPNTGHNVGDKDSTFDALSAFFYHTLHKEEYPAYSWQLNQKRKITLDVNYLTSRLNAIKLWQATSLTRDFRKSEWSSTSIDLRQKKNKVKVVVEYPQEGYKAFFVELEYQSPIGGTYTLCTSAYVADTRQVFIK